MRVNIAYDVFTTDGRRILVFVWHGCILYDVNARLNATVLCRRNA